MKRKFITASQQKCNSDVTIFGANFLELNVQKKHIATEETCVIVVVALLVLTALFGAVVLTLHLF